jgi:hypothetical protein
VTGILRPLAPGALNVFDPDPDGTFAGDVHRFFSFFRPDVDRTKRP